MCSQLNVNSCLYIRPSAPIISDIIVTEPGVNKLLKVLKSGKASGVDSLPTSPLKECAIKISNVDIHTQSNSEHRYVSKRLEIGKHHAHLQKGPHDLAENDRPVSLTYVTFKTMEHIVYSHIADHIEMNNILTPRQHIFRRNYSCDT